MPRSVEKDRYKVERWDGTDFVVVGPGGIVHDGVLTKKEAEKLAARFNRGMITVLKYRPKG